MIFTWPPTRSFMAGPAAAVGDVLHVGAGHALEELTETCSGVPLPDEA